MSAGCCCLRKKVRHSETALIEKTDQPISDDAWSAPEPKLVTQIGINRVRREAERKLAEKKRQRAAQAAGEAAAAAAGAEPEPEPKPPPPPTRLVCLQPSFPPPREPVEPE
eukprot:SAG22_NODE_1174_length_5252_cov_177.072579_4_plen_111_part_00